jgi:AcrR family transcriptional regulator
MFSFVMSDAQSSVTGKSKGSSHLPSDTRQRLIIAALTVFAENGFHAATTREIARRAGVNEVTLFRHFRTRDELLKAVLLCNAEANSERMLWACQWEDGIRDGIARFVREYNAIMEKKEPLARALIGEGKSLPKSLRKILIEKVKPYRQKLEKSINEAKARGEIRSDLNALCLADILRDIMLASVLRRTSGFWEESYSVEEYLDTVIALFVDGTEPKKK